MVKDFEFKINIESSIDESTFHKKVLNIIQDILNASFSNFEKRKIIDRNERLNFACPYCGDSVKDIFKKRANVYKNGYNFHCYNCGTHVTFENFIKDFGKSIEGKEIVYVRNLRDQNKQESFQRHYIDNSYFFNEAVLKKYAIEKNIIFDKYNLVNINSQSANWIRKYLFDRNQFELNNFGWDQKYKRLFIFNLIKENKVLGFQVRNFKSNVKYITHTLEMIYKYLDIKHEKNEEFLEVNKLSFLFGLNTTDFNAPIIITEGPLDSFLIPNGMSVCGINNEFPFEIANLMWMYDCDPPGTKKAVEKIMNSEYVFLWKKYIKDIGFDTFAKKIDYSDIVKFARINNKNLLPLNDYFSNNKYDAFWI